MKSVPHEEGHHIPRGVPVQICSDSVAKLSTLLPTRDRS
jgi:hypothetical protein